MPSRASEDVELFVRDLIEKSAGIPISISDLRDAVSDKFGLFLSRSTIHRMAKVAPMRPKATGGRRKKSRPSDTLDAELVEAIRQYFEGFTPGHLLFMLRLRPGAGLRMHVDRYCIDAIVRLDPEPIVACRLAWRPLEKDASEGQFTPEAIYRQNLKREYFALMAEIGQRRHVNCYAGSRTRTVVRDFDGSIAAAGLKVSYFPLSDAPVSLTDVLQRWLRARISGAVPEPNPGQPILVTRDYIQQHVYQAWERAIAKMPTRWLPMRLKQERLLEV